MSRNIGIHTLKNPDGSSCFFVEGYYGNSLYGKIGELPKEYDDFFKAKGGIYKIVTNFPIEFEATHKRLFTIYGASTVVFDPEHPPHQDFPVERWGLDFYGSHIEELKVLDETWIVLHQRDRQCLLVGPSVHWSEQAWSLSKNKDKTLDALKERLQCFNFALCSQTLSGSAIHSLSGSILTQKIMNS